MSSIKENSKLEMICFDVGMGDCIFATCDGKSLLVDGGGWYTDSVKKYFAENDIKKIDCIVCTHTHTDHIAGLLELMREMEFDEFICNTDNVSANTYLREIGKLLSEKNKTIHVPSLNEKRMLGQAVVEFIGPDPGKKYDDENNYSLVIRLSLNKKSILLMADALREALSDILLAQNDLKADIIKIPHHGFNFIDQDFIHKVSPQYAIISYAKNRVGKLSEELLEMLSEENIGTFRTDLCGDVYCCVQGNEVRCARSYEVSQLAGKKLLILAANAESIPIVRKARKMGIYTIVTDHIPGSPAKEAADKYFDVDGKDVDALAKIVEQEKVDGILVGCADPLVPSYVSLCKRASLPCIIQESALEFLTNKKVLKQTCEMVGIPVVKNFFTGKHYEDIHIDKLSFPVIVKPTVGRGGKGVSLCNNAPEVKKAFAKAKYYSDSDEVMIEEYFDCDEVTISYLFYNGVPHLIGLTDRIVLKKEGAISAVTYGNLHPSEYTDVFIKDWYEKFYQLLRKIRIHNGLLNIQMFVKDGKFYPYDPDGVLNAELSSAVYPKVYQIDIIQHFIEFALTGNMQIRTTFEEAGKIPHNKVAASIWIILNPGKIETIRGKEILENNPGILHYIWRLDEGAIITEEMAQTEKATLARIWIAANNERELKERIVSIRTGIKVFDVFGNDLVYR